MPPFFFPLSCNILTTYKNSIKRGKDEKRWLPLQYFISSFIKNQGKIKALSDNNSGINIVTIDNSNNQNKEVSIEDAFNWDYTVSKEQFEELKNSIKDDTEITEERKEDLLKGIDLGSLAEIFGRGQVSDGRAASEEVSGPESSNGLGEGLSFIDEETPNTQYAKTLFAIFLYCFVFILLPFCYESVYLPSRLPILISSVAVPKIASSFCLSERSLQILIILSGTP